MLLNRGGEKTSRKFLNLDHIIEVQIQAPEAAEVFLIEKNT